MEKNRRESRSLRDYETSAGIQLEVRGSRWLPPQPFVEWCARMDVTSLRTIRSTVVTREHVAIYIPVAYSLQITKRAACCTRNCTTPADLHTPKTGERREIIETLSRQFSPANDEVLVGSCSFRHRAQFRSLHRMFRKRSPKLYGCVPRSPLNRRRSYARHVCTFEHDFPFAFVSLSRDSEFSENGVSLFYLPPCTLESRRVLRSSR